jgi:DNA-binding YbaB/EbfC family protein
MAIGDMMGMMKQAKLLSERMEQMQAEIANTTVDGAAGGGLVKVTVNGKSELKEIKIDPSLLKPEEAEILEDLVVAAVADARHKAEAALAQRMKEITGGLQLPPGMKLPI